MKNVEKKVFILSIFFILCVSSAIGQNLAGFWDVPFGASRESTKKIMSTKKAIYKYADENNLIYEKCNFAGNPDSHIMLVFHNDKMSQALVIVTPNSDVDVFNTYNELKIMIKSKYPSVVPESAEGFNSPYYKGDGYETQAVKVGKATFVSNWRFANDDDTIIRNIVLYINPDCTISLLYRDLSLAEAQKNSEIKRNSNDL